VISRYFPLETDKIFAGHIELDESHFGGIRKGKRGGKVYTIVVDDTKSDTLLPVMTKKTALDSVAYTDSYRSYNALDISDFHHERIKSFKSVCQREEAH